MALDKIQEKILFTRLVKKDKEAFIDFYKQYIDQIYRYIYFKVGTKEEAEDLTSSFFIKVWNSIQEGNIVEFATLKAYFYTIARNLVIDHYRKNANAAIPLPEETDYGSQDGFSDNLKIRKSDPAYIDDRQDIEHKIDMDQDIEMIKQKIFKLKDEYREVIILKYLEGLSTKEIAVIIDKTLPNTRVLSHRALKALKELIEKDL